MIKKKNETFEWKNTFSVVKSEKKKENMITGRKNSTVMVLLFAANGAYSHFLSRVSSLAFKRNCITRNWCAPRGPNRLTKSRESFWLDPEIKGGKMAAARNCLWRGTEGTTMPAQILRASCIFSNCKQLTSKPDTIDDGLIVFNL